MKFIDLTGQRFGMLTVLGRAESKVAKDGSKVTMWRCKCDCGNECVRSGANLRAPNGSSCGCRRAAKVSESRCNDLTGQRFGRLVVLSRADIDKYPIRWNCRCDCGKETVAIGNNLVRGHTTSCGCFREEGRAKRKYKHGLRQTRIYSVWCKMKDRCYCENNPSYPRYGGRGITMCDEWKNDVEAFAKWAYANGYREDAEYGECTVDRIDNNKGYSPDNCRITDMKTQSNNRRSNLWIEHNGEKKTLAQWGDTLHIDPVKLRHLLIDKGMTIQEVIDKGMAS